MCFSPRFGDTERANENSENIPRHFGLTDESGLVFSATCCTSATFDGMVGVNLVAFSRRRHGVLPPRSGRSTAGQQLFLANCMLLGLRQRVGNGKGRGEEERGWEGGKAAAHGQ